jgi:aspartate-semialdehyde dehydrogenase
MFWSAFGLSLNQCHNFQLPDCLQKHHLEEKMNTVKTPVALLGATGTVGQKVIALLDDHPQFELTELAASNRSAGKLYGDCVRWRENNSLAERIKNIKISSLAEVTAPFAISCLPASVAIEIEPMLNSRGIHVVSNASAFRMDPTVPLVIPEINSHHLSLLTEQKHSGKLVTNPNCSTVFLALGLAPLLNTCEIEKVDVVTLQALSGAGYPGVSSCDIMGNIIPYISNEEDKIENESQKILGSVNTPAEFPIMAHVHRVPVMHGHTVAIHITCKNQVSLELIESAFQESSQKFSGLYQMHRDPFHPQPLRDITWNDQRCHIGRLKISKDQKTVGFVAQGHNLVRGAAGAAILNLEALNRFLNQ